jgi:hypothetical protein
MAEFVPHFDRQLNRLLNSVCNLYYVLSASEASGRRPSYFARMQKLIQAFASSKGFNSAGPVLDSRVQDDLYSAHMLASDHFCRDHIMNLLPLCPGGSVLVLVIE